LFEPFYRLGMTQPGLSRQNQRLERKLGTRLLEKRGTGAILTDAGRESMQFAIRTISDFDAPVSRFDPDPSALNGVIRIVASSTPAEHLIPALVAEFTSEQAYRSKFWSPTQRRSLVPSAIVRQILASQERHPERRRVGYLSDCRTDTFIRRHRTS